MRARSFVAAVVAQAAVVVAAVACGLDEGGLLDMGGDASIDATTQNAGDDAAAGDVDASGGDAANADAGDANADGAPGIDATDSGPDTGPCNGVVCNGACVDASTCEACDGSPLFCATNATCASSCTSCGGLPIQCFDCDSNRANPVATCQPLDASAYCLNGNIYPRYHCGCPDDDAGECPGATQTCSELDILTGNVCRTCGEDNTEGAACKGGGICDEANAQCR